MPEIKSPNYLRVAVGRAIRARRIELGLTQYELGQRAGLSKPSIANIESARHGTDLLTLARLADALDTSPAILLTTDTTPPRETS